MTSLVYTTQVKLHQMLEAADIYSGLKICFRTYTLILY